MSCDVAVTVLVAVYDFAHVACKQEGVEGSDITCCHLTVAVHIARNALLLLCLAWEQDVGMAAMKQYILDQNPELKQLYQADDNMAAMYITDGEARFFSFSEPERRVNF